MLCRRITLVVVLAFAAGSAPAVADDILAGIDLFTTPPGDSHTDAFNMIEGGVPIPKDFFGPGSDRWEGDANHLNGRIDLEGEPFPFKPEGPCLEDADTIVRRLTDAIFPDPCVDNFPVTIDIEIVALNLVASQPITVTFNDGQNPQQWDVRICVDPNEQTPGIMTLVHHCMYPGGTFETDLPVSPTFIFTHAGQQIILASEPGDIPDVFSASSDWVHEPWSFFDVTEVGPGAVINSKCGGFTLTEGTSNFVPGIMTFGVDPEHQKKGPLNAEEAALAAHGVFPAQDPEDNAGPGGGGGPNGIPDSCEDGAPIPTVSEWGLMVMAVLMFTVATVVIGRRRPAAA